MAMDLFYDTSRRSALHFGVFIVFALWMTIFVLARAQEAVEEIERLSSMPAYTAREH